jgi:hypothetical protein
MLAIRAFFFICRVRLRLCAIVGQASWLVWPGAWIMCVGKASIRLGLFNTNLVLKVYHCI